MTLFKIILILGLLLPAAPFSIVLAQEGEEEFVEGEEGEFEEGDGAAEGGGGGGGGFFSGSFQPFWRIGVLELMSPRFNSPHPFKQLTGSDQFDNPGSGAQMSFDYLETVAGPTKGIFSFLHMLPPVSIDYVVPFDTFIQAFSFGYYHTNSLEFDAIVRGSASGSKGQAPLLKMKTYYDLFYVLVHPFFSPDEEGLDVFVGLGLGTINGTYEGGFRGRAENDFTRTVEARAFEGLPVTFRQFGLDHNGETFGFRFTLVMLNKEPVISEDENYFRENPNGLAPNAAKDTNFAGILMRVALTWKI